MRRLLAMTVPLCCSHAFAQKNALIVSASLDPRWSMTAGERILTTETGCYNGRNCEQTLGTIQEPEVGLVLKWGK